MVAGRQVTVGPADGGTRWTIDGVDRFEEADEAVEHARVMLEQEGGGQLIVLDEDGEVAAKETVGSGHDTHGA